MNGRYRIDVELTPGEEDLIRREWGGKGPLRSSELKKIVRYALDEKFGEWRAIASEDRDET